MFQQALIIGVGLLGSSVALALKEKKLARRVVGCSRSQETLRKALKLNIISGGTTEPSDFVKESDLIIFAMPLCVYSDLAEKISDDIKHDAILTDVGSVKACIVDNVLHHLSSKQRSLFVPGHPIAGSENSGLEHGNADLFEGRPVILTPVEQTNKSACNKIEEMWTSVGARVSYMTPDEHDKVFAHVSHAIQFIAFAYRMAFPEEVQNTDLHFKRFFRIAKSDPGLWADILLHNKKRVTECVAKFKEEFVKNIDQFHEGAPLPVLIAKAADEMAADYVAQAGQGFGDFTSPLTSEVVCNQTISDAPSFLATLDGMLSGFEDDNLMTYLPTKTS